MKEYATSGETGELDLLTDKQCRALDLLIEHKTSKEIARELGISPYTVDQRISLARAKLGVSSRSELAARYQVMRKRLGRAAGGALDFPAEDLAGADPEQSGGAQTEVAHDASEPGQAPRPDHASMASAPAVAKRIDFPTGDHFQYRVGPEVFDGSSGGLWRVGAIVAAAFSLVMTILGLFAIYVQLNELLG